jgi:RNA polymerase sigma factor (sigma-70 family)
MERDDRELLTAWRDGDKAAGEQLFKRHFESIRRFFRNKATDSSSQEELTQDTFLRCVKGVGNFRGESSFRTFLFAIARHAWLDHLRKRGHAVDEASLDHSSIADLAPGPASILVKKEQEKRLVHALRQISINDQMIIEMYRWEQMSANEIGEVMEMPEGTIRSRLGRIMKALAHILRGPELSDEELASSVEDIEGWLRSVRAQM